MSELAAKFDAAATEAEIFKVWMEEKCFSANPSDPGEPYCIVIPPPNVTGALHLGHAINNTLQDMLIRIHRMKGFNTVWIPGVDHAGIATQAVVEKQLKEKENKTRHDVGREGLVERIWEWKQQYGDRIISQLQRMGCSCDWDRTRFTLDDMCARAVRETFFKLFKDGLVFRGKRLVNWDTHLQTSISDDELYTEAVKTSLWSIKYPISSGAGDDTTLGRDAHATGGPEYVTVATTRPETMLADTAVAYHSSNPHAAFLKGKFVKLPLTGRLIPLVEDDVLVDPEFGTGYVKVTPGHDPNDYAVYQRHLGKPTEIAILNLMTTDGKVNDADPSWKSYAGLTFSAARKKVVEDLAAAGLHNPETDVKPHDANVNFSDRSKTAIQPYLSDQWFVKMADLAEPALEVVRNGTIKFFPERHGQQYLAWLGEKRDWPISRQLWWGHRIPVWRATNKFELPLTKDFWTYTDTLAEWIEKGKVAAVWGAPITLSEEGGLVLGGDENNDFLICVRDPADKDVSDTLESIGFVQDPDVLDTWFSSGLWPHSTLGWPEKTPDLAKWYPGSVLLTGRDIITLWVARMVMMGLYNMRDIPFKHVAINPTILDGKGERMSKSKGNGVDPVEIIDSHGADALRFTLATMATETQDVRLPVKKDAQGRNTSEKFDLGRNFATKIWNASKFAISQIEGTGGSAEGKSLADRWIVSRFATCLAELEHALATYRFDAYAKAAYEFFWNDLCGWYLEVIKPAMKDPARAGATAKTLGAMLDASLRVLHPAMPFITEAIWTRLNAASPDRSIAGLSLPPAKRLVRAAWPAAPARDGAAEALFARAQEVTVAIRNLRNEHKVDQKKILPATLVDRGLTDAREIIELMAGVTVTFGTTSPQGAATLNTAGTEIHVQDVVDPNAEANRLAKRKEDLAKQKVTLEGRLASPAYTEKAPAHLVEQTRKQLAEIVAELEKL